MGFLFSSSCLTGLYFARSLELCTVILPCGSVFAGYLFTSQLQTPRDSLFLVVLLLQTVPSTALQESRLTPSPGAVNMPSCPVSGVIGGKINPAYSFRPCFLCLSTHASGKDNATFVVTSLVSKQMPL